MGLNRFLSGILVAGVMASHNSAAADSLAEGREACRAIANKLASVSQQDCSSRQLTMTGAVSVKGQPILIQEFPPLASRRPQARVLLIGGIHGDELSSVSVVFKWMKTLSRYHSGLFHWRIVPLVNPDGLLQRKSKRINASGVDLNRNFPTPNWEAETRDYWVRRTGKNPRRFPGLAPLSEPETRWLVQEIERFQPDVIVSVHAPFGVLDFDGHLPPPNRLGNLYLNLLGTYPGSLGNFGVQRNIPVVTIELPSAGIMPSRAEVSRIWVDLVRWLRSNVRATSVKRVSDDQAGPS